MALLAPGDATGHDCHSGVARLLTPIIRGGCSSHGGVARCVDSHLGPIENLDNFQL